MASVMRVAAGSSVKNVAMCLVRFMEKPGARDVELRAIGAGAVNQAVKAIAAARRALLDRGADLRVKVDFFDAEEKTAVRFVAFLKDERRARHE